MRRANSLGSTLVAAIVAAVVVISAAPNAAAATQIKVSPGFGGQYVPGMRVPVTVTVSSDRLLRGDLQIVLNDERKIFASAAVEIPGGSVKDITFVVPTALNGVRPDAVRIVEGGKLIAKASIPTLSASGDQELVGLTPGALAGADIPPPAQLQAAGGVARFYPLKANLLDRAPASIESLSIIGVGAAELPKLPNAQRRALLAWVATGGHLVVDEAPGPVPGLPDRWFPREGGTPAGAGRVTAASGAMAAGRWNGLFEPTQRGGTKPLVDVGNGVQLTRGPFGGEPNQPNQTAEGVASDAGVTRTPLGWIFTVLLIYILLAGPVLFFVLRRWKQSDLAWIAIPLLAVVFTGGTYLGGTSIRRTRASQASVILTSAAGATAWSTVGVSGSGGVSEIGFPRGWESAIVSAEERNVELRTTSAGPQARLSLGSSEFGVASASGPVDVGGELSVEFTKGTDGAVSGTVVNHTRLTLTGVAVLLGKQMMQIGALGAGDKAEFTLETSPSLDHWVLPGQMLWRSFSGFEANRRVFGGARQLPGQAVGDFQQSDAPEISYGLWQDTSAMPFGDVVSSGRILAVGWTKDFKPDVKAKSSLKPGRSLVLGISALPDEPRPIQPYAVTAEQVRGPGFVGPEPGWDELDPSGGPLTIRYGLPTPADGKSLVLDAPVGLDLLEVWVTDHWEQVSIEPGKQPVDPNNPNPQQMLPPQGFGQGQFQFNMPNGSAEYPLPALTGRVIYLRATQSSQFGSHNSWALLLREAK